VAARVAINGEQDEAAGVVNDRKCRVAWVTVVGGSVKVSLTSRVVEGSTLLQNVLFY
jgi:hypothetical protein